MQLNTTKLPDGTDLVLNLGYSIKEAHGVTALVVISCFSLVAVIGLIAAIAISAYNTRSSQDQHLFVRTHVFAYFLCILTCDLLQAIGSIMNSAWIRQMSVSLGDYCTAQAVIKHMADVATAFWSLVIAIHTFCLIVLGVKLRQFVLWTTMFGGWSAIFAVVIAGPASLETYEKGPFFTISGYWCWISPDYAAERITLDYMIMFLSALFSFTLYTLIYLKLRGNLVVDGSKTRFVRVSAEDLANWRTRRLDDESMQIAKQMLLYPIGYVILLLPIAITRFATWAGHEIPFEWTIFSAAVFLCSGFINVTLFLSTRPVLPPKSMRIFKISRPTSVILPTSPKEEGPGEYYSSVHDPYYGGYAKQKEEQKQEVRAYLQNLQYEGSRHSFESDGSAYSSDSPAREDYDDYESNYTRSSDLPPQVPQLAHLSHREDEPGRNHRHSSLVGSDFTLDIEDYEEGHPSYRRNSTIAPNRPRSSYYPDR
ncbi:hypothetical protein C8J56DRAFT_821572 [Mycena floridula]|nr:hypothetical protein C8J56DRAFT_821572 [Mycena floridula]